jgi:aminoglycoside 3-N-acetyltransferase
MSPSLGYRDAVHALRDLGLNPGSPALVVGSPDWVAEIRGGIPTLISALLSSGGAILSPAFTFQTMIVPSIGPPDNGLKYGSSVEANAQAEFFHADLPVHPTLGPLAEALRTAAGARRTGHPILSFVGINADAGLTTQTLEDPWWPIAQMASLDGDLILLGVEHTANIALHLAEQRAGRKQFIRWALTPEGVVECPAYPGCSRGFTGIEPRLRGVGREGWLGSARLQLVPLRDLLHTATAWIREDPGALLCDDPTCELCNTVRASLPSRS